MVQWLLWNLESQKGSHRSNDESSSVAESQGTPCLQKPHPWHLQYEQWEVHCFGLHHSWHSATLESPLTFDLHPHISQPLHLHSLQWSARCLTEQKSWHSSTSESHTPMGASEEQVGCDGATTAVVAASVQNGHSLHLHKRQWSAVNDTSQKASHRSYFASSAEAGLQGLPRRQKEHAWHLHSEQC